MPETSMESRLALEMVRVTEAAAIASARYMGRGDNDAADQAADRGDAPDDGRDRDARHDRHRRGRARRGADALHRRAGRASAWRTQPRDRHRGRPAGGHQPRRARPGQRDHRPGRVRAGRPAPRARTRTSRSSASGPSRPARSTSRVSPAENVERIAAALGRRSSDITVVILDRPRHADLIDEVRGAGARIKLITDGDLSAAISLRGLGHRRPRRHGHRRRARRASSRPRRCAAWAARSRPASGSATTRSGPAAARMGHDRRDRASTTRGPRLGRATSSSPRPA